MKFLLLKELQKYNQFTVCNFVNLETINQKGIMQTSIYDNVQLHWDDSAFKFWDSKHEEVDMFINSNIREFEWNSDTVTIHIIDCPKSVIIRCSSIASM